MDELARYMRNWSGLGPLGEDGLKANDKLTYERAEEMMLDRMEGILSFVDNAIALQALFPSNKLFKPFGRALKHASAIYVFMLLLYIKRAIMKLQKINKYIRIVKAEMVLGITAASEVLEKLYTEKVKAMIDAAGYLSDFMLNISLIFPKMRAGRLTGRLLGALSWLGTLTRFLGQDDGIIAQMQQRYSGLK